VTGERYVLLGLAPARADWFAAVARWATAASIPAEFVKCVSVEQVHARLASGRAFSALLVDGDVPALDRDLLAGADRSRCAVVVVDDSRPGRDWPGLGAAAVLPRRFGPEQLVDVLVAHAPLIGSGAAAPVAGAPAPLATPTVTPPARVAMCCGPGGTGASTVAMALAQGLALQQEEGGGGVLLADFARHAEQAVLHDADDIVPGVQELVDAHRTRRPPPAEVRSLAFAVEERGYDLLLGLRRAQAWSALRPRAVAAAFDGLLVAYGHVVVDADADLEGEDDGGSADVEDRNALARTAASAADVVLVVGLPGVKGAHSLMRVLNEVCDFGVPPDRVVPVISRAPRHPRARAELAATVARLGPAEIRPPVFLPERPVDDVVRDGMRLPPGLTQPLVRAHAGVTAGRVGRVPAAAEPERIVPGSLGSWEEDAG
jgi:Mrp family chromosome partitioning ATPase